MKYLRYAVPVITFSIALAACDTQQSNTSAKPSVEEKKIDTSYYFNTDGSARLPEGYRKWEHVGTTRLPKGFVSIINQMPIKTAQYIQTYVEPEAFNIYIETGIWPEGARFVKEFVAIKDQKDTEMVSEDHYAGLALIIKDSNRFPKETGNLGYFNFGHHAPPYAKSSPLMPRQQCSSCHENLASKEQYIFASHHIGLARAAK